MGDPFCNFELITHDLAGAKEFYAEVFDWKLNEAEGDLDYTFIDTGSQPGGGMMPTPEPGVPTAWVMYLKVDDLQGACAQIRENGGAIFKEPAEIPGYGSFAVACDPQGAYFGLCQYAG